MTSSPPLPFPPAEAVPSPEAAASERRTRIISVGGGKGGVGKSIVSGNLAVAFARMGHRVVLADLDLGTANQHLLLGVDTPRPGIGMLLDRAVADPRDALTETAIDNLWLLAGTGATLGAANITYGEKVRILRRLRALDADVVVVDVGAGVGYNALDFFELGAQRLVVTTPQVTAIHDAYAFLKGAVLRTLHHHSKDKRESGFLQDVDRTAEGEKVVDLLATLRENNPAFADRVFEILQHFGAYLVGNQVLDAKQAGIFQAVSRMMQEFLGVSVPILGWLKHSTEVHDSVNSRQPLILGNGNGAAWNKARASDNARVLFNMAEALLAEDVVLEEELLIESDDYEEVAIRGGAGAPMAATESLTLTPDALILPTLAELNAADEDDPLADVEVGEEDRDATPAPAAPVGTGSATGSYLGTPHARVYQPPPRKKPRPKKKKRPVSRRSITLPGMVPVRLKAAD